MQWKDVMPGVYSAKITDYGLEEVAKLNNAIKVVITLDVACYQESSTHMVAGKWEGFIETKEGKPNQKTMNTLAVCGMKSDDIMDLATKPNMLDTSIELEVQVIRDGEYTRIDWINRQGQAMIKKAVPKVRPGVQFKAALADARRRAGPAPEVNSLDSVDEIPF